MKLASHCSHTSTGYRLVTPSAQRATTRVVMSLTQWKAVILKETSVQEWGATDLSANRGNSEMKKRTHRPEISNTWEKKNKREFPKET